MYVISSIDIFYLFVEQIDYTVDSESEWEEPCRDGEELRSDADDLSDSETMDSESDTDSFIVPHGHLSDDELNEDEQQQVKIIIRFFLFFSSIQSILVCIDKTSS